MSENDFIYHENERNAPKGQQPRQSWIRSVPLWAWVVLAVCLVIFCCGGIAALTNVGEREGQGTAPATTEANDEVISHSRNEANPPAEDVEITKCRLNEHGWIDVRLEVTNHSSKASDYSIDVEVVNGRGDRVDTVFTFIPALRPDQMQRVNAGGVEDLSEFNSFECRLLEVDRWASE